MAALLVDDVGALEAALQAMRASSSPAVQHFACAVLSRLPANRLRLPHIGAKEAVAAMVAHPRDECVQEAAACALSNLATVSAFRVSVVSAGSVPALLAALQAHLPHASVQQVAALTALEHLTRLPAAMEQLRASSSPSLLDPGGSIGCKHGGAPHKRKDPNVLHGFARGISIPPQRKSAVRRSSPPPQQPSCCCCGSAAAAATTVATAAVAAAIASHHRLHAPLRI